VKRIAPKPGQDQSDRRGSRSGRAYVAMPTASESSEPPLNGHPVRKDWRKPALICLIAAVAVAGIGGGGYYAWHNFWGGPSTSASATSTSPVLLLSDSDIDQQLTQEARDSLQRGQVPTYLRNSSQQVLDKIKNGEVDLTRKQLFDPTKARGTMIHVYVTIGGQLALTDVLTEEHQQTMVIPVSKTSVTNFHFVVDSAGANGTVTCWVASTLGPTVHTAPLATGAQADLQAQRH
jgi:hypothetical protein